MKLLPLFLLAVSAFSQTPLNFSFDWVNSVTPGVTGYKLYGGPGACPAPGGTLPAMSLRSGATLITTKPYKIPAEPGTNCFVLTAVKPGTNPDGTTYTAESAFSVGFTMVFEPASAPTGLTGKIVP